eukprot:g4253.t1
MVKGLFVLYEQASGYALFEVSEFEEIAQLQADVQASISDVGKFTKLVSMKAFAPFTSAVNALENINDVSEGIVNETLRNFLETNLPTVKPGKKAKFTLGVIDPKMGSTIQEELSFPCQCDETVKEILRGVRCHFPKIVTQLDGGKQEKAQLGLGHSYSRCKVKFNVHRSDNMIIQSICLLDQLDKDLNTFAMRVREWYSWHFPELIDLVKDNYLYSRCVVLIKARGTVSEEELKPALAEIVMDDDVADKVIHAGKISMGMDVSEVDMLNIENFASRVVKLTQFRKQLHDYLRGRMETVAPNLAALIGEMVGARLISHAGSLTNLAKCPASTVQILGAEKALFRALKTKGNTPKYGLIYHSSFIGRAGTKNKGRISRYLANKCAIASRIDSFADKPTDKYGIVMRDQVEDRLKFYSGELEGSMEKNIDCMKKVAEQLKAAGGGGGDDAKEDMDVEAPKSEKKEKKKKKKRKAEEAEDDAAAAPDSEKKKKKKKDKKKKEKA